MDEKWQKSFPVSWDQFHRDARALAWRLSSAGPFSAVVAITRGGLVPAAIVARELGIRVIETVCVASYDYDKQGAISVLKNVSEGIIGKDKGRGFSSLMTSWTRGPRRGWCGKFFPRRILRRYMQSRLAGPWLIPLSPR